MENAQKRTLIAVLCKLAWADGVVEDSERDLVRALVCRLGGQAVSDRELDSWLDRGAPDVDVSLLGPEHGELAFDEAIALMRVDGDVAEDEQALVSALLARVLAAPVSTPLARLRLVKRQRDR